MKRTLAIILILVLSISLAFPALALAKRGGVPANDKAKPNAASTAAGNEQAPAAAESNGNGNGKDKQKDKAKAPDAEESDEATATNRGQAKDKRRGDFSAEASATAEPKLTGVENALSRLQRNLERMQVQLEAGTRDALPVGLQAAIAKFMSWLGIDPASEEAENTDEGSTETSGTVEPEPVEDDVVPDTGSETPLEEPAAE